MPTLTNRVPAYRRHLGSGQAVVDLSGRDFYLGEFGTAASRQAYDRRVAEWIAAGRRLPVDEHAIKINEVVVAAADSHHGERLRDGSARWRVAACAPAQRRGAPDANEIRAPEELVIRASTAPPRLSSASRPRKSSLRPAAKRR